jgi:hypothetical protein
MCNIAHQSDTSLSLVRCRALVAKLKLTLAAYATVSQCFPETNDELTSHAVASCGFLDVISAAGTFLCLFFEKIHGSFVHIGKSLVFAGFASVVLLTCFAGVENNVVIYAAAMAACCADEDVAVFCVVQLAEGTA